MFSFPLPPPEAGLDEGGRCRIFLQYLLCEPGLCPGNKSHNIGWPPYDLAPLQVFGEGNGTPLQYSCLDPNVVARAELPDIANKNTGLRYRYTMEYYSAIKRNETESSVVMWIDLDSATQSEVSRLTSRNLSPTPVPSPSPPDPNHRSTVSFIPALMESSLSPSSQMNNQSHSYCTAFPTGCKSVQGPLNLLNGSKSSLISAMFCSG